MRDWNLPRPLVRWLDALSLDQKTSAQLKAEVFSHLEGLESRASSLRPLLAAVPESAELWAAYRQALDSYREALSDPQPRSHTVIDSAVALEEAVLALRDLAGELPRVTGNGALDEIFAVGMSLARGAEIEPEALLSRLIAGRAAVLRLQSQGAIFARAFPQEEEISRHLSDSVDALEEGLGGAFLYLAEEPDADLLEQAMRTLASGGTAAVAALAAMREVSEDDHRFSEDAVLEELFRAVEAGDPQRVEVAMIALDDAMATLSGELSSLLATFAPENWRVNHLAPLRAQWEKVEAQREVLNVAHQDGTLTHDLLHTFQNLSVDLDELENEAAEALPNRASLPDVSHLVGLIELMGAVFEERAPLLLLRDELARMASAYREYQAHLEKVYEGESADTNPDLEHLLEVSEELGEGLTLLDQALETGRSAQFPRVWEALVEPARELHRLSTSGRLEGFTPEPEMALPSFFSELRDLWRDRLARRIGAGEFMQALSRASKEIERLAGQIKAGAGAPQAAALGKVVSEMTALCRNAMTGPDHADLATIEKLGLQWESFLVPRS